MRRLKKIVLWFFLSLLFLLVAVYIFIQTPYGQNWIGKQVTRRLSRDLQTKVTLQHIDFSLFNRMHLEGLLVEDRQGDTLLFAGDLSLRITDWFFLRKSAELKYVGLKNALIQFQRTDSVWRQQFLFDHFAGPPVSADPARKKKGITFDLRKVEMDHVVFRKRDDWLGEELVVQVGALELEADSLRLSAKRSRIRSLVISAPQVMIRNYPRRKPRGTATSQTAATAATWNPGGMDLRIDAFQIVNGSFRTEKDARSPLPYFDGRHLAISGIRGMWRDVHFAGDSITAQMELSARERSGIAIRQMKAAFTMTPRGMYFRDLDLRTDRSHLTNAIAMTYPDLTAMSDFIHAVRIEAIFDSSEVHSDDIAHFAPALRSWNKSFALSGTLRGRVDDWDARDLQIRSGSGTVFSGDLSMTGLPRMGTTFIACRARELRTTYSDAMVLAPAIGRIQSPDLRALGYLQFRGEITGFLRDFVTTGTLRTGLGQLTADLSMKLPVGRQPVYSGHIKTDRFQLGRLLHDQELGDAGFALSVRGSGFRPADRSVTLQGQVNYLDYRTDRFDRITVDGRLEKRRFEGVATLQDALARFTLNGTIDLNGPLPRFNLLADIAHADLRGLHLVRDSVTFSGKANVDFIGSDLDDFMGTARITEARLTRNEEVLPFDSLVLATTRVDGLRSFEARSNEFRAELTGDYHLDEVPATARVLLHRYYPSVVKMPASMPRPQAFRFDIESYYIDPFLQLIDPTLTGFNNTHLKGRIDLPQHLFVLDADIPQFRFRGTNFESIRLVAEGNADRLVLNGQVRNVNINDSLSIPQAYFRISARNDSSRVSVQTGASQAVEKADLNALVLTYDDGLKVEFEPSTFTVNGKAWTIGENGEVVLRSSTPASGQLLLTEGDERILLRTRPSDAGKWNDIDVELTNVNLGDFAPFFLPHNRLEGLLSGRIRVENPTGDLRVVSDDLSTRFLRLDNDSLGGVRASVDYDGRTRELKLRGATENQENYLGFEGSLYLNDPASALSNRILLRARQFEISVLERFLGNLFSDMQGYLTGDIQLSGPFGGLTVTGKGRLKDAGLKVKFTQCFYRIEDTDVELTPSEIRLDGLVLRDPVTGNPIFITGGIEHRSFRDMFYDLTISTRKPQTVGLPFNRPVQLLQTTYRDNKQFYGNARGTGSLSLIGPQENLYMKIDVVASETDSSSITLPPSSSRESGVADFMVERRYGREMTDAELRAGSTNIIYDVDITVNKTPIPRVAVKIMLDELTGDEIKGKGSGSINIRSGTSEPLRLRGRFDIEEGSYLFTFQSFFKKPFELRKGGDNYIEWNGDPYDANIRFQAMYRAERVSFAPLAELLRFSSNASNARGDVYVVATLTEKLFKPVIQFALDFPSGSIAVTDPELALVVQQMQKNINEINRQVTYLIVFNSFAPSELTAGAGSFNVAGTISGIFLNVISDQINKILGNLLKSDKYTISLNTSIYNRNIINTSNATSLQLGSNINFSIGRSFFNNRFIVSTGLGFDAPLQAASANTQVFSQQLLPDVTLEWLINNSGSLRASFFYRENTDFLSTGTGGGPGRARRIGASLSYRRDFDRLQDLLRRKLATQPPVTEPPPRQP